MMKRKSEANRQGQALFEMMLEPIQTELNRRAGYFACPFYLQQSSRLINRHSATMLPLILRCNRSDLTACIAPTIGRTQPCSKNGGLLSPLC